MSIDYVVDAHVAKVVINRPERMNALDAEHYRALSNVWTQVRDDPEVRVAIVTGAGDKAFCAGADIKSFVGAPAPLHEILLSQKDPLLNRGLEVWKPIIAAINGHCIGGGVTLMLATDLRVAARSARFSVPEIKRGIFAANGGTQRITQQLPHAIAMELLLLGESMDAETALRWGLINKIVDDHQVIDSAMEYATQLARSAPLAVQATKELAIRSRDVDLNTGLRMEQLMLRLLQTSEDVLEGTRAFAEKRSSNFNGR